MSNGSADTNPKRKIRLEKNLQLALKSGFGTLITADNDEDYRNAIISIHNGVELLMKYYLREKDKKLIFKNIDYKCILYERGDLIKEVKCKTGTLNTITFEDCINILQYFSKLPEAYNEYLKKLNNQRNDCIHFEYWYVEKELRKLLISNIYEFICMLISEMKLDIKTFILQEHIIHLDKLKHTIDDEIGQKYYRIILVAIKHYFKELTADERKQKAESVHYEKNVFDEEVECPACGNKALLRKEIRYSPELLENKEVITQNLILKDLSCHHCALSITDYDLLKLVFKDKEKALPNLISYHNIPDDCAPDDCAPDDCAPDDCAPDDCAPDDC